MRFFLAEQHGKVHKVDKGTVIAQHHRRFADTLHVAPNNALYATTQPHL